MNPQSDKPHRSPVGDAFNFWWTGQKDHEGWPDSVHQLAWEAWKASASRPSLAAQDAKELTAWRAHGKLYGFTAGFLNYNDDCHIFQIDESVAALSPQAAHEDSKRLLWLETLLEHCPHAELKYNDDPEPGDYKGWTLIVESCSTLSLEAPTLTQLIDIGIAAKADEDGNVVASALSHIEPQTAEERQQAGCKYHAFGGKGDCPTCQKPAPVSATATTKEG